MLPPYPLDQVNLPGLRDRVAVYLYQAHNFRIILFVKIGEKSQWLMQDTELL